VWVDQGQRLVGHHDVHVIAHISCLFVRGQMRRSRIELIDLQHGCNVRDASGNLVFRTAMFVQRQGSVLRTVMMS